jgi:hypothetical protein
MDSNTLITQGWMAEHPDNPDYVYVTVEGARLVLTLMQCLYECDPHNYKRLRARIGPTGIEHGNNRAERRANTRRARRSG